MIDFEEAEKQFKQYVSSYDMKNENIKLKLEHSFRVEQESYNIAQSLNLSEEQKELAKLIGLLHDIGRFEQVTIYNTFKDSVSIDHAEFGVEQLIKNNFIRRFISTSKYDKIIFEAIRNHNKYSIDSNLNEEEMLQAKIIRDADKLDIMNLLQYKPFQLLYKKADISDENQVKNMIDEINEKLGGIDILVNNAALCINEFFKKRTAEDFKRTLEVNILGTYLVSKYASKNMINKK